MNIIMLESWHTVELMVSQIKQYLMVLMPIQSYNSDCFKNQSFPVNLVYSDSTKHSSMATQRAFVDQTSIACGLRNCTGKSLGGIFARALVEAMRSAKERDSSVRRKTIELTTLRRRKLFQLTAKNKRRTDQAFGCGCDWIRSSDRSL